MKSTRHSFQILTKLEFSQQIFEKYSNIKFHENLSCGSRVVSCGQTDIYGKAICAPFAILRKAPKNDDKFITCKPFSRRCYKTETVSTEDKKTSE